MITKNFTFPRGDTFSRTITWLDESDQPYDLTDGMLMFTVKKDILDSDDDAIYKEDQSTTGVVDGVLTFGIDKDTVKTMSSELYHYDVQYVAPSGDVRTLIGGQLVVPFDVTQRSS